MLYVIISLHNGMSLLRAKSLHKRINVNSLRMCDCCLIDAKALFEPFLKYCCLDHLEQISVKFESNVVCKMEAILSQQMC